MKSDVLKSRSGRYEDTSENRRLHRVGQQYGQSPEKEVDKTSSHIAAIEKKLDYMKKNSHIFTRMEGGQKKYEHSIEILENKIKELRGSDKSKTPVQTKESNKASNEKYESGQTIDYKGVKISIKKDKSGGQDSWSFKAPEISDKSYWDLSSLKNLIDSTKENKNSLKDSIEKQKEDGKEYYERKKIKQEFIDDISSKYDDYVTINNPRTISEILHIEFSSKADGKIKNEIASHIDKLSESKGLEPSKKEKDSKGIITEISVTNEKLKPVQKKDIDEAKEQKQSSKEVEGSKIQFSEIPNSSKVNLKKYLSNKIKSEVDEAWKDINKIDSVGLEKMEKGLIEDFNRQFEDLSKSRRAEKLYSIMKVKAELNNRSKGLKTEKEITPLNAFYSLSELDQKDVSETFKKMSEKDLLVQKERHEKIRDNRMQTSESRSNARENLKSINLMLTGFENLRK